MGHLKKKYTREYFLGATDQISGRAYGVVGHEEFKAGHIHERHRSEFLLTLSFANGLNDKEILDIGVGRGDHVPLFLREGIRSFHGIDFAPASIAIARQHVTDPRAEFQVLEARDLGEHRTYDVITMLDVVEHIPVFEMDVVWRKIRRILRPGGVVAVSTPIFESPNVADHSDMSPSVMGVHCHKQTVGTLLRSSAQHGFLVAFRADRFFGLVRSADLTSFSDDRREQFLKNQRQLCSQVGLQTGAAEISERDRALLVPAPGRLAIGCVAENSPKYLAQALRLVQSIRWFGGAVAGANVFVCVVGGTDSAWETEFERWGAFVRVVERFSEFHAQSNKLRFLELPELSSYDTVMLMDCDTVVVQDPSPFLKSGVFRARIADGATVPHDTFKKLFAHYGIELPAQKYRCTFTDQPTVWYCNAGVLIFPRSLLEAFYPVWRKYTMELAQHTELLGGAANFCEQASLTLAFHASPMAFRELPAAMNFPLHRCGPDAAPEVRKQDPVVIHYHDLTDPSGFLQKSQHNLAQARIEALNRRMSDFRGPASYKWLFLRRYTARASRAGVRQWRKFRRALGSISQFFAKAGLPFVSPAVLSARFRQYTNAQRFSFLQGSMRNIRWRRGKSADELVRSPTFIVGCIRSGTTILAEILGKHPDIVYCPFELKHIWSQVGGVPMASPKTGDQLCPQLGSADARADTALRLSRAFAVEYRTNFTKKNIGARFLSKNPHLCNKLPFVDRLFAGETRFVWIYRDLPSVAFSVRRLFESVNEKRRVWHYWPEKSIDDEIRCWQCFSDAQRPDNLDCARLFPGGDMRFLAEYWLETNRAASEFRRMNPRRTLVVREEDLIAQPDETIARILAFLEVRLDVAMLDGRELNASRNTIWIRRMDETDRSSLLGFVREHSDEIDQVFPVKNLATVYEGILSHEAKND